MNDLKKEIQNLFIGYDKLYKSELIDSEDILEYWKNEFFWWKREAIQDVLELFEKYWY